MNIFKIKRGQNPPDKGILENYELGFCSENQSLYIGIPGTNPSEKKAIQIGGALDPNDSQGYLGQILTKVLPITGGAMQGNINMGGNRITGIPAPVNNYDATSKLWVENYVTAYANGKLSLKGGNMKGQINMSGYDLHGLPTPVLPTSATNKSYVDNKTKDFLLEMGNTNGWYWEKWNSGKAICYQNFNYTVNLQDGNKDSWVELNYAFPFTFKELPIMEVTISNVTNWTHHFIRALHTTSKVIELGFATQNSSGSTVAATGVAGIIVIGRWK